MEDKSLQRTALLVTTLSSLLTPMMASAVNVALPAIASEFAMNAVQLGWVASAYLLAAAVFLLPFGRLADIDRPQEGIHHRHGGLQRRLAAGRAGARTPASSSSPACCRGWAGP